ncbi:hypothetical protein K7I13_07440 [Brucepastera parasyntrophica]|uniref:hypothetical protein n=1 Tax=Brucepastera parasyntrophica TaxID=2880008 RepID=UPI00210E6A78|nr:hypothetical protein [Brucepastera parasyntrophica]ULQ61077.1 hypothetical protein K7I13_07440 [Brucepastera parasyntrophica]
MYKGKVFLMLALVSVVALNFTGCDLNALAEDLFGVSSGTVNFSNVPDSVFVINGLVFTGVIVDADTSQSSSDAIGVFSAGDADADNLGTGASAAAVYTSTLTEGVSTVSILVIYSYRNPDIDNSASGKWYINNVPFNNGNPSLNWASGEDTVIH